MTSSPTSSSHSPRNHHETNSAARYEGVPRCESGKIGTTIERHEATVKPRNPREAAWWNNATPPERVAYFLGTMRGLGHTFPDHTNLTTIQHRLGMNEPTSSTIVRLMPPSFDPTAQCDYPGCEDEIGPYLGGRYPRYCPPHRITQRRHGGG